jgi:hypothetical protein
MAQRKKWGLERMKAAIEAIRNKEMSSYKASRVFNVPQTTLWCYINLLNAKLNPSCKSQLAEFF